ncbi:MAG: GlsB/YeaQ/YmgE family stress response membrane protein, partial [Pseudomonadota bacterium]|nr:GlsB/YeaQ/YmgE family stress response membrane protein [Pseudomonadota bacterium]
FVLRPQPRWRILLNLAVGVAGAVAGGIAEGHGAAPPSPWDVNSLIVVASGALILIGIVNLFRRTPEA